MADRGTQYDELEQQLVRFALENDGEFCVSATQLREAINTGEVDIPGKGPLSKDSALLDILGNKERITGGSSGKEVELAQRITEGVLARVRGTDDKAPEEG